MSVDSTPDQVPPHWNDTDAPWPEESCIHHLFETQARATPSRVALIEGERHVTYGELLEAVEELSSTLVSLGVGSDVPVALMLQRSAETVTAIYGVLHAGGFYVPIETSWPTERVSTILRDAQPAVLLTRSEHLPQIPESYGGIVLCLDRSPADAATAAVPEEVARSRQPATAASALYCFYTSGTSGDPKGVIVEHRGLVKRIQWFQDRYGLEAHDRVLNRTPYSFGISEWEYFWALLHGATLVIAAPAGERDPRYLHSVVVEQQVTVLFLVPSALNALMRVMRGDGAERITSVTRVFTCGEALSVATCAEFPHAFQAQLVNLYGPTEADMTFWECPRLEPGESVERVPIGRPISNVNVHVLDEDLQPVPIGTAGELYFGGANTARGYLNRPELTAEAFIDDPFSEGRLYKTGDVGRWAADGNLELLGRVDDQVKIRGFRIELEEIRAHVLRHPAVEDATVISSPADSHGGQLVAYAVPAGDQALTPHELRRHLAERVPDYMIPAFIVLLESIPLTPNGKVDRKALPSPDQARPELGAEYVAPRTALEESLAGLWREVLGIERVGLHDDFFHLGGDSLRAVELQLRVEKELKRRVPIALLLKKPTLEEFAAALLAGDQEDTWSPLVPITPEGAKPPLFFAHAHGGQVVGYSALARELGLDQPFYGLQAQGLDGVSPPIRRIDEMAARYVEEVQKVQASGPYHLGGFCLGGYVALEMARLLEARGERVGVVLLLESPHPDYPVPAPGVGRLRQVAYSVIARLDLEAGTFLEVPRGRRREYVSERFARLVHSVRLRFGGTRTRSGGASGTDHRATYIHTQRKLEDAHAEAYETYEPQPCEGPMVVLAAKKQPLGIQRDPTQGWGHTTELEHAVLPGHRLGLLQQPRLVATASQITQRLTAAQQRTEPHDGM